VSVLRTLPVTAAAVAIAAAGAFGAAAAPADSTPIGPLPEGPVTHVQTTRGSLVAVALPRQKEARGLVWRVARPVNARILRQLSEADVGPSVVLVFRAIGTGRASVRIALTRGESSGKAVRAVTYHVRSR
jgi:hypothetical protein